MNAKEDIRLIPVGFVNNRSAALDLWSLATEGTQEGRLQGKNWKCDTTTDPDFFWAKPE